MNTAVAAPFRWTKPKRRAAAMLAIDDLDDEVIASKVGVSSRALWYWKAHPDFKAEINRLTVEAAERVLSRGIARKVNRIAALDDRWQRMKTVVTERAGDLAVADVPGGRTGLIVRQLKQIGAGRDARIVEEYAVDTGLLREMRETEKQAAQEVGEWEERQNIALTSALHVTHEHRINFDEFARAFIAVAGLGSPGLLDSGRDRDLEPVDSGDADAATGGVPRAAGP